jgi:hypothetical protein
MTVPQLVAEFSLVSDWERCPVRAMDLHPRLPYLAVARQVGLGEGSAGNLSPPLPRMTVWRSDTSLSTSLSLLLS